MELRRSLPRSLSAEEHGGTQGSVDILLIPNKRTLGNISGLFSRPSQVSTTHYSKPWTTVYLTVLQHLKAQGFPKLGLDKSRTSHIGVSRNEIAKCRIVASGVELT